jgi:hypothetical protein
MAGNSAVPITAGTGTNIDSYQLAGGDQRQVIIVGDHDGFKGAGASWRVTGRAGTTGQKIAALHNATGSTVRVAVNKVTVDLLQTAVIAVTVIPPIIRLWKFTAVPTSGTNTTKVPMDSSLATSNASVTMWGDASADGTNSTTALTVTLPAGTIITQEFAPRLITAAGYEALDRVEFLQGADTSVILNPLEGICVFLDYTLATQNPITNFWVSTIYWEEYTP